MRGVGYEGAAGHRRLRSRLSLPSCGEDDTPWLKAFSMHSFSGVRWASDMWRCVAEHVSDFRRAMTKSQWNCAAWSSTPKTKTDGVGRSRSWRSRLLWWILPLTSVPFLLFGCKISWLDSYCHTHIQTHTHTEFLCSLFATSLLLSSSLSLSLSLSPSHSQSPPPLFSSFIPSASLFPLFLSSFSPPSLCLPPSLPQVEPSKCGDGQGGAGGDAAHRPEWPALAVHGVLLQRGPAKGSYT